MLYLDRIYTNFFSTYQKAYFDLEKQLQFETAQKFQKEVKNNKAKYEETVTELNEPGNQERSNQEI